MQPLLRPRGAIVEFVRMKDDDVPRRTELRNTTVAEGLDALQRHADRIGVVPVHLETVAAKARVDALDPAAHVADADAVGGRARTFKIFSGRQR